MSDPPSWTWTRHPRPWRVSVTSAVDGERTARVLDENEIEIKALPYVVLDRPGSWRDDLADLCVVVDAVNAFEGES